MCFYSSRSAPAPAPAQQRTFDNSPPVVTGMQTGIENPKDTKKATEKLEQDRRESERFFNPGDSLKIPSITSSGSGRSGRGNLTKQQQAGRDAARRSAKKMAESRIAKKKSAKGV